MHVRIFNIGFDKNKRLWMVMIGAVTIAILLIVISFIAVYSNLKSENIINVSDIKEIRSYKASYTLNVKSNKNQNNYKIEEEYIKDEESEFFEFDIFNGDEIVTYTFDNGTLNIKSNKQKLVYVLSDYIVKKENIISLATFLELYREIDINEDSDFKINIEEHDNKISYKINIYLNGVSDEYEFLYNISMLELITNKEDNKIEEYVVYDDLGNAYIDIIYDNFLITN